ncbi:hypothetical protein JKP88DRAFT_271820 [Tribonema minus]|uniref:Non-canonical E2 ubiquitin-conjugating enzyme C-terminal domain-containing protein n=1 Tax=Tribonema minus TaxID=303371 RepID=A0A835Z3Z0_9STRA|nr:hypothetical protein JKP88DRAFT_271820 [Tribonema minus]
MLRCSFVERAKYIPLRLTLEERQYLRLLESALSVSDYTGTVDREFKTENHRKHKQMEHISALLGGLVVAVDYDSGQELLEEKDFTAHDAFFQDVFEIGRRHKIMNPEKMRTEYGKMIYLMQDTCGPVGQLLHVNVMRNIKSVYYLLQEKNGLAMLEDQYMAIATKEILPDANKSRAAINQEIKMKERAVEYLKRHYCSATLSKDDIHTCLYSMCDNDSFLNSNRLPIDKMIAYLKRYFSPENIQEGYSLAIVAGEEGARLTHSHERQYNFALQSLTLWREIIHDMFRLWCLAELDLLSSTDPYTLTPTGQGLQRVQPCPRTHKAMQEILYLTQKEVKNWVGSSVIHLGDKNVPNSLMFIDKYTQVSRILSPIVMCLEQLAKLTEEDKGVDIYIEHGYGGVERLTMDILHDFFRCAFDGSGADNFYEAGSCIDGRLTSAWNWCSQLSSKPFYPVFKLTGFMGFDGDWQK